MLAHPKSHTKVPYLAGFVRHHSFTVDVAASPLLYLFSEAVSLLSLQPNKPAAFQVNLNNAKGQLKTYVDTPSGTEDDVFVQVCAHACLTANRNVEMLTFRNWQF